MANVVGDEMLGKIARQQHDWFRRVREGSMDPEKVLLVHGLMQDFADGKIPDLSGVARGTHEIKLIDHIIDLSIPCELPFAGAENISPTKSGVVKLERRGDDLFVNGQKLNLFLSEEQKVGTHSGHDLRKVVEGRGGNQSAKLLDYLKAHPELWPESLKKDEQGRTLFVFFWDDIFRSPDGFVYVRYGCWDDGRVVSLCSWLGDDWSVSLPAASVK